MSAGRGELLDDARGFWLACLTVLGLVEQSGVSCPVTDPPIDAKRSPQDVPPSLRSPASEPNWWRRSVEWLWLGHSYAESKALANQLPPETRMLMTRARHALEVAQRLHNPAEPYKTGTPLAAACDQYGQAAYWALLGLLGTDEERQLAVAEAGASGPHLDSDHQPPSRALLLERLGNAKLQGIDFAVAQALRDSRADWAQVDFRHYGRLDTKQLRAVANPMSKTVARFVSAGSAPYRTGRIWKQRFLRSAAVVLVGLGLVVGGLSVEERVRLSKDLARGKPWKASSDGGQGCHSPDKECDLTFFFHTKNESQPWIILDLLEPKTFSGVHIVNRTDCCFHRAIPLLIEVEDETGQWREVARRNEQFETWRAEFDPVTSSRVRLRASRWTFLHLKDVKVLP